MVGGQLYFSSVTLVVVVASGGRLELFPVFALGAPAEQPFVLFARGPRAEDPLASVSVDARPFGRTIKLAGDACQIAKFVVDVADSFGDSESSIGFGLVATARLAPRRRIIDAEADGTPPYRVGVRFYLQPGFGRPICVGFELIRPDFFTVTGESAEPSRSSGGLTPLRVNYRTGSKSSVQPLYKKSQKQRMIGHLLRSDAS